MSKKCDLVHNVKEFICDLEQLLKFSPKRVALFEVRGGSIENVLCNHELLQKPMREIQQGHRMKSFDAYFGLTLALIVFSSTSSFPQICKLRMLQLRKQPMV